MYKTNLPQGKKICQEDHDHIQAENNYMKFND